MPDAAKDAALEAARDLLGGTETEDEATVEAEAEDEASEQTEATAAEAEEVQQEADEVELPDEIKALLEEPDFESEAEEEFSAQEGEDQGEEEEGEEADYYEDDEKVLALKKELLKAQKKAAWFEDLRSKSEKQKWVAEAEKYFPYADASQIDATSRRGFLRAAKAEHEGIKTRVETALAADREKLSAEREKIREEVKAEVEAAWGKVTTGPGVAPANAAEKAEKVEAEFRRGGFVDGVRAMLVNKEIEL